MKRLLLLIVPLLSAAAAKAADSDTVYTIERCYELTENNYPLVKRYDLISLTEEYTLKNAYMHYFPQISLSGKASYQSEALAFPFSVPGIELPTFSKDQYNIMIELSQVIWDGGQIAAERRNIRAKSETDRREQEVDMYSLREKVNDLYFGILLIDKQIRQTEIILSDLSSEYGKVTESMANGVANRSDLDMIEVEMITRRKGRTEMESMLEAYMRMLSILTGVKIDSPEMLTEPVPEGTDMKRLLTDIIVADIRRPELELYAAREKEIDTQWDYWTAKGLPKVQLFIRGGYGRPGLNMMDDTFQPFAIGGIQLVWNISELYSLGYGKKIISYSKSQINTVRETFLFNTGMLSDEKITQIRKYFKIIEDDDRIVKLREQILESTRGEVENGTLSASDLIREINKTELARMEKIMHEIELMKSLYELKTIKNN